MTTTINADTTNGVKITSDTSGVLGLQTNGNTAVTIDGSQNVGIGVTPSAWSTSGTIWKAIDLGSTGFVAGRTGAERFYAGSNGYYNGTNWIYKTTGAATYYASNLGQHEWYNAPSGTAGNAITFTQAMTLGADGNMILGGTSPTTSSGYTSLSINNATNSGYVVLQNNGTNKSDWYVSGGTVATLRGVSVPLSLESTGANHIKFETNGTERARIDSNGNWGLGVTPNTWTDLVPAFQIGNSFLCAYAANAYSAQGANAYYSTGWKYRTTAAASVYQQSSGVHSWSIAASGTAGNTISFTQAMTLDASGNLGIGTTSPLKPLDVTFAGTSGARRFLVSYDDSLISIKGANNSNNPEILRIIGDNIRFNTGITGSGTEAARIDASGNLGVGITSPLAGYRGHFVDTRAADSVAVGVRNLSASGITRFVLGNDIGYARFTIGYNGSTFASNPSTAWLGTEGSEALWFKTNDTARLWITSAGYVGINTSSPQTNGAFCIRRGVTTSAMTNCSFSTSDAANSTFDVGHPAANVVALSAQGSALAFWSGSTERFRFQTDGSGYWFPNSDGGGSNVYQLGKAIASFYMGDGNGVTTASIKMARFGGTGGGVTSGAGWVISTGLNTYTPYGAYSDEPTIKISGYATEIIRGNLYSINSYSATVGATNRDLYIDNTGIIGYVSSTRESKTNITSQSDVSWLLALEPVQFNRRKKEKINKHNAPTVEEYSDDYYEEVEYGLIAEDVESINKNLCFYDVEDDQKILRGVHYSKLATPLLKLVQLQNKAIQEQQALITQLQADVAALKGA